jgi:hypothetical protein
MPCGKHSSVNASSQERCDCIASVRDHAGDPNASGAKKRGARKVTDDPSRTLCAREDLEMDAADLSVSVAVDPLFHHESESLQESKIANLQLYTLDVFSGCDVLPTSDTLPGAQFRVPEAKAVSPALDLAWTRPHWQELASMAAAQEGLAPTLQAHLPRSARGAAVDELLLNEVRARAPAMRDAAGTCWFVLRFGMRCLAVHTSDGVNIRVCL